jgi:hypothetical protein
MSLFLIENSLVGSEAVDEKKLFSLQDRVLLVTRFTMLAIKIFAGN